MADEVATVIYRGERIDGDAQVYKKVGPFIGSLNPRYHRVNHSPDGFEWGYGGSGPAQLAWAICADALDGDEARAIFVYHEFKMQCVARLMKDTWELTKEEVLRIIHKIELKNAIHIMNYSEAFSTPTVEAACKFIFNYRIEVTQDQTDRALRILAELRS